MFRRSPSNTLTKLKGWRANNFEIRILPVGGNRRIEVKEEVVDVFGCECEAKGWFLAPEGVTLTGLRVLMGETKFVAKRKQLRFDVLSKHPQHPDAFESGFSVTLQLKPGTNFAQFQYKDEKKVWHTYLSCRLRVPTLWWLRRNRRRALADHGEPINDYEEWRAAFACSSSSDLEKMAKHAETFERKPLISLLMPTYNTPEKWLRRVVESVQQQAYPYWEFCIADDCSPDPQVKMVLAELAAADKRIKVVYREKNGHICHTSNSALELCTGEFTALLDHDDELPPDALYFVAWEVNQHPDCNIIFSDEDKIDEHGVLSGPYFKPGWNYDLLLGENAVSHLGVFRTSLLKEIGGFRPGWEGSQDWDLTLRSVAKSPPGAVRHIPRVLYHWRTLPTSTAASMEAKPYASVAARRAVTDHLEQTQKGVEIHDLPDGRWHIKWPVPEPAPLVSIIMPTKDMAELLSVAARTVLTSTAYPNFELIIVDHASEEAETKDLLKELAANYDNVRVVAAEGEFNWSRLNNVGVAACQGEVLLFLNNDVEVQDGDWLQEMVSQALRSDIGAVGAALLYPSGLLQHAGVVLGMSGVAGHVFRNCAPHVSTYGGRPQLVREVSAVTGACLAVRRSVFEEAGRFDENLPVSYNDIDFCLRLRSLGYRNLYTPFARLVHHESASRGMWEKDSSRKAMATEEAKLFFRRWPDVVENDPFYNANLTLENEIPILGKPRLKKPWLKGGEEGEGEAE